MTEADFIAALRALPLHPGAFDLSDDAARIAGLVVTTDTLVEGVHFLATDPPEDVAWKLVATNLSDLAAKGALPEGILLNYPLSRSPAHLVQTSTPAKAGVQRRDADDDAMPSGSSTLATGPRLSPGWHDDWDAAFLVGLGEVLTIYATPLIGGDTVSLPPNAPRVLTVTAFGRGAIAPPRSGAREGDALWVTGTIGDAGAGLAIARGEPGPATLLARYRRPQPRLAEGRALAPYVHAMMDVSDGLLIDAVRMAAASDLAVTIDLARVPLSDAYRAFSGDALAAATAGDDYELLFAAPADWQPPVHATRVGSFASGSGLTLIDDGAPVPLPARLGFEHGTI